MGEFLKKHWESRDKIIQKILDNATIFYYTNNCLYKTLDVLTPMGHQE
jgi:hypothetical protein